MRSRTRRCGRRLRFRFEWEEKRNAEGAEFAQRTQRRKRGLGGFACCWVDQFVEIELGGVELDGDVLAVVIKRGDADDGGGDHL